MSLCCIALGKRSVSKFSLQGFDNVFGSTSSMHFSGLMVSKSNFQGGGQRLFPGRGGYEFFCQFF